MAKPYVIGIDMGGTNTVFGIVDARGNVIASSSIKTGKHSDFNDYIDELHTELSRLIADNDAEGKINGIGIGAPNGNYYTGMIDQAPNLPWPMPIPLAEMVTKKFGIPCLITNDANAAAIAEIAHSHDGGKKDGNRKCHGHKGGRSIKHQFQDDTHRESLPCNIVDIFPDELHEQHEDGHRECEDQRTQKGLDD